MPTPTAKKTRTTTTRTDAQTLRCTPRRVCHAAGLSVLALALLLPAGGCRPDRTAEAQFGPTAAYLGRTLSVTAEVPAGVPAVIAVAEAELRARGYSVEKTQHTAERGRVEAQVPRGGRFERVRVQARVTHGEGIRIQVTWTPLGDSARSRVLMEAILDSLGVPPQGTEDGQDAAPEPGGETAPPRDPAAMPTGRPPGTL